ncbi:MAG: mechanosensitive ion channel family protein [Deltaproteobacteria bacterium]|nr:mechanosensitive ion channel family protein [Deltaproteobacteria bacterium]
MDKLIERLSDTFSWERLSRYLVADLLPDLAVAALVFGAFYLLHRGVARVANAALSRTTVDETARLFVLAVLRYTILTIGAVSTLAQLGIDTGGLITSLGVAGLTIGFAARDTLSNIISGIFIFWDRPFVVGDLVEVGSSYGMVKEITMRSTRIVTVDGKMLAVPNSTIVNSTVASYTNFPHLRLDIELTIGVDEDIERVRELLLGLVQGGPYESEPAPRVVVTAVNDYNLAIELRAWITDERQHVALRFQLREQAYEALRSAGVEMPLETLALAPVEVRRAG